MVRMSGGKPANRDFTERCAKRRADGLLGLGVQALAIDTVGFGEFTGIEFLNEHFDAPTGLTYLLIYGGTRNRQLYAATGRNNK